MKDENTSKDVWKIYAKNSNERKLEESKKKSLTDMKITIVIQIFTKYFFRTRVVFINENKKEYTSENGW